MKKAIQLLSLALEADEQPSNSTTTVVVNVNEADYKHVNNMVIGRIARIPGNKTQSGKAIVVIYPENGKHGINRSEDQFLIDLKNSFLIGEHVTSVMDEEVNDILAEMQSGDFLVNGRIASYDKGSKYRLDEYSREVKGNPALLGEERERTLDTGIVLRGTFLTIKKTSEAKLQSKIATATGKQMSRLFAGFTPTAANNGGGNDNAMQPQESAPVSAPTTPTEQPAEKVEEAADMAATAEGAAAVQVTA